jgi:hypothetical protein
MKIAIRFGDNDFYNTFKPLMENLYLAYQYNKTLPTNKESLLHTINNLSYGFYLSFQQGHESESTKDYLIIDEKKLLLNEEVDLYLKECEEFGDNSSTFILDTELFNSNVYVI